MDYPPMQPAERPPALLTGPHDGSDDGRITSSSPWTSSSWDIQPFPQNRFFYPPSFRQYSSAGPPTAYTPSTSTNHLSGNHVIPYNIDPLVPFSMPGPSEPSHTGFTSGYLEAPQSTAVNQYTPSHEHKAELGPRSSFAYAPTLQPTSGHTATPEQVNQYALSHGATFTNTPVPVISTSGYTKPTTSSTTPEHVLYWEYVSQNAVIIEGPRLFVPQTMYQPQSQGDKDRYVAIAKLQLPIIFFKENSPEWGIPLGHLLSKEPAPLLGGNEPAFTACGPTIAIRVLWPGYPSWHKQICTKDYTSKRNVISKARLARLVAKAVKEYMDAMSLSVEGGSNPRWKVGPHYIGVRDVHLVSLHHVSQGSWQPHLRLRFASSHDQEAIIAGPSRGISRQI